MSGTRNDNKNDYFDAIELTEADALTQPPAPVLLPDPDTWLFTTLMYVDFLFHNKSLLTKDDLAKAVAHFKTIPNDANFCRAVCTALQVNYKPRDLQDNPNNYENRAAINAYFVSLLEEKIDRHNKRVHAKNNLTAIKNDIVAFNQAIADVTAQFEAGHKKQIMDTRALHDAIRRQIDQACQQGHQLRTMMNKFQEDYADYAARVSKLNKEMDTYNEQSLEMAEWDNQSFISHAPALKQVLERHKAWLHKINRQREYLRQLEKHVFEATDKLQITSAELQNAKQELEMQTKVIVRHDSGLRHTIFDIRSLAERHTRIEDAMERRIERPIQELIAELAHETAGVMPPPNEELAFTLKDEMEAALALQHHLQHHLAAERLGLTGMVLTIDSTVDLADAKNKQLLRELKEVNAHVAKMLQDRLNMLSAVSVDLDTLLLTHQPLHFTTQSATAWDLVDAQTTKIERIEKNLRTAKENLKYMLSAHALRIQDDFKLFKSSARSTRKCEELNTIIDSIDNVHTIADLKALTLGMLANPSLTNPRGLVDLTLSFFRVPQRWINQESTLKSAIDVYNARYQI